MSLHMKAKCYCKSEKKFETCCSPFIAGRTKPKIPEQLMRSRYTAFCLKNTRYLMLTHHPSKRLPNEMEVLEKTAQTTQWLGLIILKTQSDPCNPAIGFVEFVAFYKDSQIRQLHERSEFIHEDNQWFYLDGKMMDPLKFARNEPCWCTSGKKYKRCHGRHT